MEEQTKDKVQKNDLYSQLGFLVQTKSYITF